MITQQISIRALDTLVTRSIAMNAMVEHFYPGSFGGMNVLARVDPITGKVFGAYLMNDYTYAGVIAAARAGLYYLTRQMNGESLL